MFAVSDYMKNGVRGVSLVILMASLLGCSPAVINSFDADKNVICEGESVEVCWEVESGGPITFKNTPPGLDEEFLENPSGCRTFTPTDDFEVILHVSGDPEAESSEYINVVHDGEPWRIAVEGSCSGSRCDYGTAEPILSSPRVRVGAVVNTTSEMNPGVQVQHSSRTEVLPELGSRTLIFEGTELAKPWDLRLTNPPIVSCDTAEEGSCGAAVVETTIVCGP